MKNKIAILILSLAAVLNSCTDMDLSPLAEADTENWFSTVEELDMAVAEYYILGYWNNPLESCEQWTDNFSYRNTHRMDILYGTMNSGQWECNNLWAQSYKLIARTNLLFESIHRAEANGVDPAKIELYKAESYFARACKYADLIFFFGDVIWLDGYMLLEDAFNATRTPKEQLIPLVYADFDKAIETLPVSYGKSAIHFTKGAAMAMKARFALYMGDWAVAAEAAKACMDLNEYELHNNYAEVFLSTTKIPQTKEIIFGIPRSLANNVVLDQWIVNNELTRNPGGYGSACPSWDLLASYLCTDGLPIDQSPLFDPNNPFSNRDPRCTMTIVEFGTEHAGYQYDPHPEVTKIMNYTTGILQDNNDNRVVNQYASYNALNWKKGIDITWTENGRTVERDYHIMRYADVLLMYAEAMTELNRIDDSVLEAVNTVRARAYGAKASETHKYPAITTTNQTELRREIRLERRVELANEGRRYMDLVRWRLATKALNTKNYGILYPGTDLIDKVTSKGYWFWKYTPTIDEDGIADFSALENEGLATVLSQRIWDERQYLWPIPIWELQICPNIKQNEGY